MSGLMKDCEESITNVKYFSLYSSGILVIFRCLETSCSGSILAAKYHSCQMAPGSGKGYYLARIGCLYNPAICCLVPNWNLVFACTEYLILRVCIKNEKLGTHVRIVKIFQIAKYQIVSNR